MYIYLLEKSDTPGSFDVQTSKKFLIMNRTGVWVHIQKKSLKLSSSGQEGML